MSGWWDKLPSREEIQNADPGHVYNEVGVYSYVILSALLYAFENPEEIIAFCDKMALDGGLPAGEWEADDLELMQGIYAHAILHLKTQLDRRERRNSGRKGWN